MFLTQPLAVPKGSFVSIQQVSGKVAIYQSNNDYSDLVWQSTAWAKLNPKSNWRFYLNTFNNFSSYQNTINVVYPYQSIGLYTISLTFASSGQVFQQTVNITDCKF